MDRKQKNIRLLPEAMQKVEKFSLETGLSFSRIVETAIAKLKEEDIYLNFK